MICKIKFKLQGFSNSNFYIFIKKLFFYRCHCQYSLKMTITTQLSYIRTGKKPENIRKTETHKVTLKGIEKTLGEPDDCTEGTELTLSIPEVGFEETPNDH